MQKEPDPQDEMNKWRHTFKRALKRLTPKERRWLERSMRENKNNPQRFVDDLKRSSLSDTVGPPPAGLTLGVVISVVRQADREKQQTEKAAGKFKREAWKGNRRDSRNWGRPSAPRRGRLLRLEDMVDTDEWELEMEERRKDRAMEEGNRFLWPGQAPQLTSEGATE